MRGFVCSIFAIEVAMHFWPIILNTTPPLMWVCESVFDFFVLISPHNQCSGSVPLVDSPSLKGSMVGNPLNSIFFLLYNSHNTWQQYWHQRDGNVWLPTTSLHGRSKISRFSFSSPCICRCTIRHVGVQTDIKFFMPTLSRIISICLHWICKNITPTSFGAIRYFKAQIPVSSYDSHWTWVQKVDSALVGNETCPSSVDMNNDNLPDLASVP